MVLLSDLNETRGTSGPDALRGASGKDRLEGGPGADRFLYKAMTDFGKGYSRDMIADFSSADGDRIDLSGLDADPALAGVQHWRFVADFTGAAGQVAFDPARQRVLFDQDGDMRDDLRIALTGVTALAASDFVF